MIIDLKWVPAKWGSGCVLGCLGDSGAPTDQDDEQWYDDDRPLLEAASPALPPLQSEEQVVPTIPPNEVVSHRRKRRPRKLARFDSAEASAVFSNNHDFGASSDEDST